MEIGGKTLKELKVDKREHEIGSEDTQYLIETDTSVSWKMTQEGMEW